MSKSELPSCFFFFQLITIHRSVVVLSITNQHINIIVSLSKSVIHLSRHMMSGRSWKQKLLPFVSLITYEPQCPMRSGLMVWIGPGDLNKSITNGLMDGWTDQRTFESWSSLTRSSLMYPLIHHDRGTQWEKKKTKALHACAVGNMWFVCIDKTASVCFVWNSSWVIPVTQTFIHVLMLLPLAEN